MPRKATTRKNELNRAKKLFQRLCDNAEGKLKSPQGEKYTLSTAQVRSIEIVLSKTMPSLQSIEQVNHDGDTASPVDMIAELKDLLKADPSILRSLVAESPDILADLVATQAIETPDEAVSH